MKIRYLSAIALLLVGLVHAQPAKVIAAAVQIEPTEAGDTRIPQEFCYAIYEHLLDQLHAAGTSFQILRSGDRHAADIAGLVTVRTRVEKFKEGSQMMREMTGVMGATHVDVTVTVTAKDGKVLLEKQVQGKVRFFGENLGATKDLGKRITKLLQQNFAAKT